MYDTPADRNSIGHLRRVRSMRRSSKDERQMNSRRISTAGVGILSATLIVIATERGPI